MNPLLLPLIALIAGILAERSGNIGLWPGVVIIVVGGLLNLILNITNKQSNRLIPKSGYNWIGFVLMFGGAGIVCAHFSPRSDEQMAMKAENFSRWRGGLDPDEDVVIEVKRVVTGEYGDRISGLLCRPREWRDWAVTSFCGVTEVRKGDIVRVPAKSVNGKFALPREVRVVQKREDRRAWYQNLHDGLIATIEQTHLSTDTKGLLKALLAGEADHVSPETRHRLADVGLAHILALSGMHVGIVSALVLILLWPLKVLGWWNARYLLALIPTWVFVAMSGMAPSTLRAGIMFSALTIALVMERKRSSFNALLIAAFIIMIIDPDSIFTAGFQLSFVCVASLIAFMEPLNTIDHRNHPLLHKLVGWLLIPIVATAGSWALSSYYFGRIPLDFLPLNLIAVPLLPFYVGGAILYLILSGWHIEPYWLNRIIELPFELLKEGASYFSQGTVIEHRLEGWQVIIWLVALAVIGVWVNQRSRNAMHPLPGSEA